MAEDFKVTGADDFYKLSKALKAAGEKELRAGLNKSLKAAAKPLVAKTRDAARSSLPQRGGLAARVAKAPQRVQTRTGRDPGVRVVVTKRTGDAARSTNDGSVRHPVFGHRDRFVSQPVRGGWFDDTLEREAPGVRPDLERALQGIADEVVRRAR